MACTHPIPYTGSTPGADSNTYVLFTSTAEAALQNGGIQLRGLTRYVLSLKNSTSGTLRAEGSNDGGTTWVRFHERLVAAASPLTNEFKLPTELYRDVRVLWINGGSAQATWQVAQVLDDKVDFDFKNFVDNAAYWVNLTMATDQVGAPIAVGPLGRLMALISWTAASTQIGTLSLQGLAPDGTTWMDINGSTGEFISQPNNNTATLLCSWRELHVFTQVRLKYTRTSGGAAGNNLSAQVRAA